MWQHHVWFLSEAFVVFNFGGIFIWHSSLHCSHSKLNLKRGYLGVTIYHFFGQSCFSVCIIYSDFRNLEMGFSHIKLKFWIHQVSELLTSLSGVLTLQGRRILQVKSLTAGPFASWKQRAVKLLRYLWKRSHDFTAELCWGQLCPTQSMEAEQEILLGFLSYGNGLCGPLQSPVWWKNWQLWSSNFTLLCFTSCQSSVGEITDSPFLLPWAFRGMRSDSSQALHSSWYFHYARVGGMRIEYCCNWDYSSFPFMQKVFANYRKKQFLYWHVFSLSRCK